MKNYPNILSKLWREPLLVTPARHAAVCQLLAARIAAAETVTIEKEPDQEPEPQPIGKTLIIPVHGTIVPHPEDIAMSECGCALEHLNAMISLAEEDPEVTRVIYDFRSPGGTVTGIPETGRRIYSSKKETVAFTDSECCSGALWLAAQCQKFYCTASSRVGSVGVYVACLDLSRQMAMDGENMQAISAGKYKLLGAYWKPLTREEEDILQRRVDKIYDEFKIAMATYRTPTDESMGNGLVFDGEEATERGFTDGVIEGMDDILDGFVE